MKPISVAFSQISNKEDWQELYLWHGNPCDICLSICSFVIKYFSASPPEVEPAQAENKFQLKKNQINNYMRTMSKHHPIMITWSFFIHSFSPSSFLRDVISDGTTQINIRRTFKHSQKGSLCLSCKQWENSEHTTSTDIITVNKPQSISNRVPHSLDTRACAPFGHEPVRETNLFFKSKNVKRKKTFSKKVTSTEGISQSSSPCKQTTPYFER